MELLVVARFPFLSPFQFFLSPLLISSSASQKTPEKTKEKKMREEKGRGLRALFILEFCLSYKQLQVGGRLVSLLMKLGCLVAELSNCVLKTISLFLSVSSFSFLFLFFSFSLSLFLSFSLSLSLFLFLSFSLSFFLSFLLFLALSPQAQTSSFEKRKGGWRW